MTAGMPPIPRRISILLTGIFITAQVIVAAYALFTLWPPTIEAATATSAPAEQATPGSATAQPTVDVRIFGSEFRTTVDGLYLLLVMAAGALGSGLATATSFSTYVGNRRLASSWIAWFLLRTPVGLGLPLVIYFAIQGGLLNINAGSSALNPYGIVAVAGFAGLFSKQVIDKLNDWANKQFQTSEADLEAAFPTMFGSPEPSVDAQRAQSGTASQSQIEDTQNPAVPTTDHQKGTQSP
jgi:hypothetical protein